MTRDEVLALCLSLPAAAETYPFGDEVAVIKQHWNTVDLDGSVEDDVVRGLISDSYDLVVAGLPRSIRTQLDWNDEGAAPAMLRRGRTRACARRQGSAGGTRATPCFIVLIEDGNSPQSRWGRMYRVDTHRCVGWSNSAPTDGQGGAADAEPPSCRRCELGRR